jgi:hypothetical protein
MGVVASAASYDREGLTGPLKRPYADSGVVLVVSSRSSVRQLNDLHGQKIGVMVGAIEHEWLGRVGPGNCTLSPSQIPYVNLSIHTARVTA